MTRRKTDGERIAAHRVGRDMGELWEAGNELPFVWGSAKANPYRGRKKK